MEATKNRIRQAHEEHRWRQVGPDLECANCYKEALAFACACAVRVGAGALWIDDVAARAVERAVERFEPVARARRRRS